MIESLPAPSGRLWVYVRNPDGGIAHAFSCTNLRTTAGRDWQSAQMGGTPGAAALYIAVTEDSTAPLASDTTLTSELASDGLTRKLGSYAHTAGSRVYTISVSFTVTGARTLHKVGLFNAASVGTLCFESALTTTVVSNGQTLSIIWSIDIGG